MSKSGRKPDTKLTNIVAIRKHRGKNQNALWARFAVTQSGGSRYGSGRTIPLPIRILITLYPHGSITDADIEGAKKRIAAEGSR